MSRGLTISAHFPFALPLAALALALAGFAPAHAARPETTATTMIPPFSPPKPTML